MFYLSFQVQGQPGAAAMMGQGGRPGGGPPGGPPGMINPGQQPSKNFRLYHILLCLNQSCSAHIPVLPMCFCFGF